MTSKKPLALALFKDSDVENTSVASLMDDSLRTSRSEDNDGANGSPDGACAAGAAATSAIDGGDGGKGSRDIASLAIDVSRVNFWIVCSLLTPHKRLSWSMYRVTWSVY